MRTIVALVRKEVLLESRQQYTLYGIVLYVLSTIFVIYLSMGLPETKVWNGLFWTVQLFVCINAVAKSFLQESKGRMLYYYTISTPQNFIISKLIFNCLLMFLMNLIGLGVFLVLLGNPLVYFGKFLAISLLGGLSLSLVFTFLAAIAAKAQQSSALMAIMGFPIIIPQLLVLMKLCDSSFSSIIQEGWWQMMFLLMAIDCMVIALAYILFPFL
ncbi:MAG: heme exporter protein CcmB, partial [Chitinophagaceae bacterium]